MKAMSGDGLQGTRKRQTATTVSLVSTEAIWTEVIIIEKDKVAHFLVCLIIVLGGVGIGQTAVGFAGAFAFAIGKELFDYWQGREFSLRDLLADYMGIAVASVIWGIGAFAGWWY